MVGRVEGGKRGAGRILVDGAHEVLVGLVDLMPGTKKKSTCVQGAKRVFASFSSLISREADDSCEQQQIANCPSIVASGAGQGYLDHMHHAVEWNVWAHDFLQLGELGEEFDLVLGVTCQKARSHPCETEKRETDVCAYQAHAQVSI